MDRNLFDQVDRARTKTTNGWNWIVSRPTAIWDKIVPDNRFGRFMLILALLELWGLITGCWALFWGADTRTELTLLVLLVFSVFVVPGLIWWGLRKGSRTLFEREIPALRPAKVMVLPALLVAFSLGNMWVALEVATHDYVGTLIDVADPDPSNDLPFKHLVLQRDDSRTITIKNLNLRLLGKVDAAGIHARALELKGKRVRITAIGFFQPWWKMYPNMLDAPTLEPSDGG